MATDWKLDIVRIVHWKQIIADHIPDEAFQRYLPELPATPEDIAAAQSAAGIIFPVQFVELLMHIDGWHAFFVVTDLFGTKELRNGRAEKVRQRPVLIDYCQKNQLNMADFVPIGASDEDSDIFLLFSATSAVLPGGVLWVGHDDLKEIDRYATVSDFFASMVNYNADDAMDLVKESGSGLTH